jgi:endonuclease YncB( thermonuclease family)
MKFKKKCVGLSLLYTVVGLLFLAGCSQTATPPDQPGLVYRDGTIALTTKEPTVLPSPIATRVLPPEFFTPGPTPTVTPLPDEALGLVIEVLTGDTAAIVLQGDPLKQAYIVRYIGIEAPPPDDPWGKAAQETNRKMTQMKVVRLERDGENFDAEGRLRRYVYVGNEMLSIILIEQGLARAAGGGRYQAEITEAQTRASAGKLGLWSGAPPTPRPTRQPQPTTQATATFVPTSTPEVTATPLPEGSR